MTVSDLAPPTTLRDLLRVAPRLAPDQAERLLVAIARALAARGAPHGALAPERVLVGPGDRVALEPPPRSGVSSAPSPTYLAPEQIDGRAPDVRSDVYALGLIGWEMLAGHQPWEGDSLYGIVIKQREQDLPRLSTLRPGLPRALVQAVEGALHKASGDRWQSPAELLQLLGATVASTDSATAAAPRAAPVVAPPGTSSVASPQPARAPSSAARLSDDRDDDDDDEAPPGRPARASGTASAGLRRRWLTAMVLGLAVLAAAGGAIAVVQGRRDSGATRAWLDSVTATTGEAGAPAAVSATTTTTNTTSAPIRRTSGRREEPVDLETPDPDASVDPTTDSTVAPALEPTPSFVPAAPTRPIRPTVPLPPRDTVLRPDTLDSPF